MTAPKPTFSGKCPKCTGYNSRLRTEVITYAQYAETDPPPVAWRTRVYCCNACGYEWHEMVQGQ